MTRLFFGIGALAAGLAEGLGGLLFAAGLFFRPACLGIVAVMTMATLEQFGRPTPAPEHAVKNLFVAAGMFFAGPGRYAVDRLWGGRGRSR